MTNWSKTGDVSLSQIWDAVRSGLKAGETKTNLLALPIALVNNSDCQFNTQQLEAFRSFVTGLHMDKSGYIKALNLEELVAYHANVKSYGKDGKQKRYGGKDLRNPLKIKLKELASNGQIEEYCKALANKRRTKAATKDERTKWWSWTQELQTYPGREHINFSDLFSEWIIAIKYFDSSISSQGYSSGKNRIERGNLIILLDYLFLYLPWYQELNSHPEIIIPYSISDFKRWAFWSNEPLKVAQNKFVPPLTVKEFYKLRRGKQSLAGFINTCSHFFEYIILEHSDIESHFEVLVTPEFKNPINREYDKEGSGSRRKTDKVAFPRKVLPFVLSSFEEFEEVNYRIQQAILSGEMDGKKLSNSLTVNNGQIILSDWDEKFEIEIGETIIPIERIPCLFSLIELKDKDEVRIFAFNSTFRMLRAAMHIGSRVQSTQWLDINHFDKHNFSTTNYFSNLFVTVDKIYPMRQVQIPSYVFKTLIREKTFQLIQIPISPSTQAYEGNENDTSYPDGITPLFNNPSSNKPFNDSSYHLLWLSFLQFLNQEYNKYCRLDGRKEDCHAFVYIDSRREKGRREAPRNPKRIVTTYTDSNGNSYETEASEIIYRPVHTPHSMRNSFTTLRRGYLDSHILMEQQGWSDEGMVDHYANGEYIEDRLERLENADKSVRKGTTLKDFKKQVNILDGTSPIKPSLGNSAMQDAISSGADNAIKAQNLISISIPELGDYQGEDGIEIFRRSQTRTNMTVFDDCICPVGGICPKEVLELIKEERRCSICPIALFGIDNIPGLKAKARGLSDQTDKTRKVLKNAIKKEVSDDTLMKLNSQLINDNLEISACIFLVRILEENMKDKKIEGDYICRDPDMLKQAFKITFDKDSDIQCFLSRLIDAKIYPQFTSADFLNKVEMAARRMHNSSLNVDAVEVDHIDVVAGHIAAIMRKNNMTIEQLSKSNLLPQLKDI
ncbi:hypothetical protein RS130_19375 [Paraglaciecola aquimarina]|uniref:Integrase n=1 Tax=Paraglaciecola aquimarina TaxID=1235557 RepID=A0ABU3T0H4_9ALTE|nr:hypothetical protein [Paraglaciecola aquimarina]MDU0355753.1 hypothetical protein [Paraglaciecola aquimarina]